MYDFSKFHFEAETRKKTLHKNAYPAKFVDKCVAKFVNIFIQKPVLFIQKPDSLYQSGWLRSRVYSLHPDKIVYQYFNYCLLLHLFLFEVPSF